MIDKKIPDIISSGLLFLLFFFACQPKENLSEFQLHPDFEIEAVAMEPLVLDPVDLEFDANGEAYVLQMPGYPKGIDQSSIVKLSDLDGDGIYDDKTLFADQLAQASSIIPYRDGFLVAAPPDLLYIVDEDGDGKADTREVLMTGFSNGNLQHNFNGLTYGLDNWIYMANGGNGGTARWSSSDSLLQINGYDFKVRPETQDFQWTGRSSGGYELAMDRYGNFYGTHNLHHINMIVFPQQYINGLTLNPRNTLKNISDHEEKGLARVYPIGEQETRVNHPEQSGYFSGACGITYYGGGSFSPEFDGNIFVNDVVLNLVHRDKLREEGSYNTGSRARSGVDFLASRDRSFRPVNSTVGPDGALYIVDMYRAVIEHPEWIPDELEAKMDLDAGKDKGRIYRIKEKKLNLWDYQRPENNLQSWIGMLEHPNLWQRMTAQRIILENNWNGEEELIKFYSATESPVSKLHILYLLRDMRVDLQSILLEVLKDEDIHLRRHGTILSEPYLRQNDEIRALVLSNSKSDNPKLLMQTALSLGQISGSYRQEVLNAIEMICDQQIEDPYVRLACMVAMKDRIIDLARLIKGKKNLEDSEGGRILLEMIAFRLIQAGHISDQLALIKDFSYDKKSLELILNAYAESGHKPEGQDKVQWSNQLNVLEKNRDLALLAASWTLRKSFGLPQKDNINSELGQAVSVIESDQTSEPEKIVAIKILSFADDEESQALLTNLVDARNPNRIQEAALEVLQGFNDQKTMAYLVGHWNTLSPTIRKRISDILIYNSENHELLFSSLESGKLNLSEFNFDLERRRRLLKSKDEGIRSRAEALFSDAGVVQRGEAIASMRPALDLRGKVSEGEKIFQVQCATCHRYGSTGNAVGPDLTEISRKSKETLLHDILDPNAGADPEFINHIVEMNDGEVVSGIIDEETDDAIFVKMMGGQVKNIPKSQIKNLNSTGLSLMPEGLEGTMSLQDMANLLAFLQKPAT